MKKWIKEVWSDNSSDSFKGKLLLLLIDKLIIGIIIGAAFFVYDQYKTNQEDKARFQSFSVQAEFEKAKLAKELWPILLDSTKGVVERAFILKSAVTTRTIEDEVAVDLAFMLYKNKLNHEDFRRISFYCLGSKNGLESMFKNLKILADPNLEFKRGYSWGQKAFENYREILAESLRNYEKNNKSELIETLKLFEKSKEYSGVFKAICPEGC